MDLKRERMVRIACALLLPFFTCVVQWHLWSLFKPFVWFLFYPTVFFSSRLGGKNVGIASSIISAGLVVYFFLPPQLSFVAKTPNNLLSVAVFIFMGFMFSYTHDLLERAKRRVAEVELQVKTRDLQAECSKVTDELIQSEERLRLALEATNDALWDWDVRSGTVFRSPRYYELVHRSQDEDNNRDFVFFTTTVHPDDLPHVLATIEAHKVGKSAAIEFDYRLAGTGAEEKWLRVKGRAVKRDEAGAPLRIVGTLTDVTERIKAEHSLRESEERFRKLFFKAPLPLCFVNHRGELTAFNDRFERTFGYDRKDIPTQEQWWLRAYPDERYRSWVVNTWTNAVARAMEESSDIEPIEYHVTCKDGTVRLMLISGITLNDELLAIFTDVTERRQKEEEAENYRTKLEAALASMNDSLLITDTDGRFINFNDAFVTFHRFGNRDECATTLTEYPAILDVHLPNGEPVPLEQWAVPRALRGETATNQLYTLCRLDTGETWVGSFSFAPMRDKNNRIIGAVVVGRDITDLVQSAKLLKESEATLRQAQRLARVGNWSWDTVTGVHHWSEEIYDIYGRDPALPPAIYPEVGTYFTPASWKQLSDAVDMALAQGEPYECDAEVIRPDGGHRWIVARGNVERDADGSVIRLHGTVQDITDRKRAEEEVRRLNLTLEDRVKERTAELFAANRELDSFAYAVSHDLRAPLRALTGFSQALLEDFGSQLQEEAKVYLEQIILASSQMGALIDGILTLSRSTRGEVRCDLVNLSSMVERLRHSLASQEPQREVTWDIEPGMWVHGDACMLEVVMQNLMDNAWKYTRGTAGACIRIYSERSKGTCCISVADNGAGFDMALSHKLFTPFQRLHRQDEFPGIGIGLATVQRIIHRHGGEIRAKGTPGAGATFSFTLSESGGGR